MTGLRRIRFAKRSDFGDIPMLLRPAQAPPSTDAVLLRPAPSALEAQATDLLRPAVEETLNTTVLGKFPHDYKITHHTASWADEMFHSHETRSKRRLGE